MKTRVAACQMEAQLGRVAENLARADRLVQDGFARGATWVILPEFFNSAVGFDPVMNEVAEPLEGRTLGMMRALAMGHRGFVGGSFITRRGADCFNTFVLARPDGSYATHDKDQPTLWEGCYYRSGDDDGVMEAGDLSVGAAVCWELLRWRTVRRLQGRIDLVIGGTCWPGGPAEGPTRRLLSAFEEPARDILREAPSRFSRLLGVPVVHASHAGPLRCRIPLVPGPFTSHFLGETQIVDREGLVLARRAHEEGEGVIVADVETGAVVPKDAMPSGDGKGDPFWIPTMPPLVRAAWSVLNLHASITYGWNADIRKRALARS